MVWSSASHSGSSSSFSSLLLERQQSGLTHRRLWRTPALLRRIELRAVLEEHDGCVNTVSWNTAGTQLVSGSDDCRIAVWDAWDPSAARHARRRCVVNTGHVRNIFCAKFQPDSGDTKVATCSLDGTVRLQDLRSGGDTLLGRSHAFVSKFEYVPDTPPVLLAAAHDGLVSVFDVRAAQQPVALINLSHIGGCTTLAFDPAAPGPLVAVGCEDALVRLYDLRLLGGEASEAAPVKAFGARRLLEASRRGRAHLSQGASGLAYSSSGELLVNLRGERMLLFDSRAPAGDAPLPSRISPLSHLHAKPKRREEQSGPRVVPKAHARADRTP